MKTLIQPHFTYNDIFDAIREYHWMMNEVERLAPQLKGFDPESTDTIPPEMNRRRKKLERAKRFYRRIHFIDSRSCIQDETEKVVLDCLLDGVKIKDIAEHLQLHRKTIERIRERIINKIYESQFEGENIHD